jgi:hypothetical protein
MEKSPHRNVTVYIDSRKLFPYPRRTCLARKKIRSGTRMRGADSSTSNLNIYFVSGFAAVTAPGYRSIAHTKKPRGNGAPRGQVHIEAIQTARP